MEAASNRNPPNRGNTMIRPVIQNNLLRIHITRRERRITKTRRLTIPIINSLANIRTNHRPTVLTHRVIRLRRRTVPTYRDIRLRRRTVSMYRAIKHRRRTVNIRRSTANIRPVEGSRHLTVNTRPAAVDSRHRMVNIRAEEGSRHRTVTISGTVIRRISSLETPNTKVDSSRRWEACRFPFPFRYS